MYVRGPGVSKGEERHHPTTHIDITATIVALAGAESYTPGNLDGLDFTAALGANPPAIKDWRQFSFSEFRNGNDTWNALRIIDGETGECVSRTAAVAFRRV